MITIITDRHQIQKLHQLFHRKLNQFFTEKIFCRVGYPGGSFNDDVHYSENLNLWVGARVEINKFWNGFGHGRPIDTNSNSISGEINFPIKGLNRRIGGVFARESNGNILVLHRGNIGGGKKGIGKRYFMDKFSGERVTAIDGNKETEFCLVGELSSIHFPSQVSEFIDEIFRIKKHEDISINFDFTLLKNFKYTDEHFGRSVTERTDPIVIERTHGIVVNSLARELKKRTFQIGKDRNRDLFIYRGKQITTLFEIKTSSSTQCLYAAIGQLLLYSIPIANKVRLVAVLPKKLSNAVTRRFASLGIEILYYKWNNDRVIFPEIKNIL